MDRRSPKIFMYNYHRNGNLLQRGQFALQYSSPNHIHAVTKVSIFHTGDTNYTYDTTGNSLDVPFFTLLYQYSKLPDDEGKQASSVALMYYQHQQVKRAGARACPASGENYGVFGNFQGAGACNTKTTRNVFKGSIEWYGVVMFLTRGNTSAATTIALAYLIINKPKSPVTIVDASGDEHDTDHSWSFKKSALRSNEEWIKKSWGNFFSVNNQEKQYWREYDALPKSYNRFGKTGKSIVASINYAATTHFDYYALSVGTGLFAIQNALGELHRGLRSLNMKTLKQVKF